MTINSQRVLQNYYMSHTSLLPKLVKTPHFRSHIGIQIAEYLHQTADSNMYYCSAFWISVKQHLCNKETAWSKPHTTCKHAKMIAVFSSTWSAQLNYSHSPLLHFHCGRCFYVISTQRTEQSPHQALLCHATMATIHPSMTSMSASYIYRVMLLTSTSLSTFY